MRVYTDALHNILSLRRSRSSQRQVENKGKLGLRRDSIAYCRVFEFECKCVPDDQGCSRGNDFWFVWLQALSSDKSSMRCGYIWTCFVGVSCEIKVLQSIELSTLQISLPMVICVLYLIRDPSHKPSHFVCGGSAQHVSGIRMDGRQRYHTCHAIGGDLYMVCALNFLPAMLQLLTFEPNGPSHSMVVSED